MLLKPYKSIKKNTYIIIYFKVNIYTKLQKNLLGLKAFSIFIVRRITLCSIGKKYSRQYHLKPLNNKI